MRRLTPSPINLISAQADAMRKSGVHIFNFAAGDPILRNHPAILEAAARALEEGVSPYAPVGGLLELRLIAAEWMNRRYGSEYGVKETMVGCGGKFGLYSALQTLVEPGDEVIMAAPYWVSYPEMIRLASGVAVAASTSSETDWKLTAEEFRSHVSKRSKVLLLNNACNPTGALYSKDELEELLEIARQANMTVIADEVYSELVFDGKSFISCSSFAKHRSRVVVIESCSKNFAMAGWRVGFAFGPSEIIANMIALQSQSTTGTALISQRAAVGALSKADEVSRYVRDAMGRRRELFFKTFNRLFSAKEIAAPSALYFFAKIKEENSVAFCEKLLKNSHVAVIPGIGFGKEGHIRFAFTDEEEEIVKGLEALKRSGSF